MSHFSKLAQWIMFGLLVGVFLYIPSTNPVQAAVACLNKIPVASGDGNDFSFSSDVLLSGKSLVWSKHTGELFHYNLDTLVISVIGLRIKEPYWDNYLAADDDHVVWIDPSNQVQLYTVSSATTLQLTDDTLLKADVRVEGNYVLWRQGKTLNKIKKLQLYDIAAATTTQLTKTFNYSLNEGRVLWEGDLYDLATATTSFLGETYLTLLNGNQALGTYFTYPYPDQPDWGAPQLGIKNLDTGIVTPITSNPFRTFIDYFTIEGDYVSWSVHYGLEWAAIPFVYQISTGETRRLLPAGESANESTIIINGRFVGFTDSDEWNPEDFSHFMIYDTISGSLTPIFYNPVASVALGDFDAGRIAWMEFKDDAMFIILSSDCGANPTIVDQTPSLDILTGRSVNLSVTTTGDQPIIYQWYQGELDDTTTPVGDNITSFITPPLTETTTYWVHTTNYFGIEDSEAMTLTVGADAELIVDGSFEDSLFETAPLKVWETVTYGVSQRCNQPDKPPVAHSGDCAARFKSQGYKLKLTQQVAPAIPYVPGDTVTLSLWLQAKSIDINAAVILLKVRNADDTKAKVVLKPTESEFAYTQFTADPLTITGVVSKAQLLIKYNNPYGGNWLIDDVSLLHQPASAAVIPLPQSGLQTRH